VDLDDLRIGGAWTKPVWNDVQVIGLSSPGVQIMDKETAVAFAPVANDTSGRSHPSPPRPFGRHDCCGAARIPAAAAQEIQRGVNQLGMNAVVIDAHTHGEYLSDTKFRPQVFEAAEAMDAPIYLHPNAMPASIDSALH
jgi:2,3-dihydroxybenzoate decarboxylase